MTKFALGFLAGAVVGAKHSPLVLFYFERALVMIRLYLGPTPPPL